MKKSSTYAAAKGTIPAQAMAILGLSRGGGIGIALEMVDVTVGNEMVSLRYPKYAPRKTSGMETQHHIATMMSTSIKGTEAEEWKKARIMLKSKNMEKVAPGKKVAVRRVQVCHWRPRMALYRRLE